MSVNTQSTFRVSDSVRERFRATAPLKFRDGTEVSPDEILHFFDEDGPRRYPNLFAVGRDHGFSEDHGFVTGLKRHYLGLSLYDRLNKAAAKGVPVILIQGGQTHEPYYAAGGIPVRPGILNGWATNSKEHMSYDEAAERRLQIRELGRQVLGIEACQTAKYEIIQNDMVPIAMVAPYLPLRCSDMSFGVEAHRHGPIQLPLVPVDFPVNKQQNKGWARDYVAENLRRLVSKIAETAKRADVTEDELWSEIRLHNEKRQLAREYADLWWNAEIPPSNSRDHGSVLGLGNESSADPVAARQILHESLLETRERIKDGVRGHGLAERPVRIFVCGSCVNPNAKLVDKFGGVLVGKDDGWSEVYNDVVESGDPYAQLAQTILDYPYELPTVERARWTAEQVRHSRADGVIFMHQWGCNTQSGIARLVADIVKKEAGVPTVIIEKAMTDPPGGNEQAHARVEVFIEMLKGGLH
jgi:benzoyl-CoA reductase/2-hydroxyglutaryl-CoA dehydratase subunit BcrC/BadD/HgdB